ncbi:MAG: terminase, partial [Cyanobacteria bacterium]|nr:terminase [Cyanobacteriota bacterium]
MGRIASTLRPTASVPTDGGLLLDPATDLWADWGLLGVPDPERATTTRQGLLFRDFIRSAFPTFQFHRLAELLIELLQQVADGQLTRLIVCTPPRHGKSQLVSRLFPAYWVSQHPELFCAIASYSGELAYAHS